jgi:hypothetical protein
VSLAWALAWSRRTCCLDNDGQSKGMTSVPWSKEGGPQGAEYRCETQGRTGS